MQATSSATSAQAAVPAAAAPAAPRAVRRRPPASGRTSTPAILSLFRAVSVVLAVLFATIGAFGVNRRAGAIEDVRRAADQLLALQDIRVRVVRADAIASSSYLRSGQEDAKQRTAYLDEIASAGDGLVAVAESAAPSDLDKLSEASRLLGSYIGLVEQARANNRQGFPIGAAYQRQANGIAANTEADAPDIVSSLRAVEASQRDRVNANLARAHRAGVWLQLLGWVLLLALVVGGLWMAGRFRRLINVPIAAAGAAVLLLLIIGGSIQSGSMSDSDAAVAGSLTTADTAAQARAAAFEAQAQEALALINRGNGAANEVAWKRSSSTVAQALSRAGAGQAEAAYAGYIAAHEELRALDDSGAWEQAVLTSLGEQSTPAGVNPVAQFDAFDRTVSGVVASERGSLESQLDDAADPLSGLRIVVFIVGIAAAALVVFGCGQRLKEYR